MSRRDEFAFFSGKGAVIYREGHFDRRFRNFNERYGFYASGIANGIADRNLFESRKTYYIAGDRLIDGIAVQTVYLIKTYYFTRAFVSFYIVIALALGLSGDVFLEVSEATVKPKTWFFVLGMLFFAAEHLLIAVNLIIANTEIWLPSLIFFAVSYSVVIITVLSTKPVVNKRMLALGLSYFVLVCAMGGCCFGTAVTSYNEGNLSLMIGGIFFIISDALLAVYRFSKPEKFSLNTALIYFYYAAQLFIASSIYFAAE